MPGFKSKPQIIALVKVLDVIYQSRSIEQKKTASCGDGLGNFKRMCYLDDFLSVDFELLLVEEPEVEPALLKLLVDTSVSALSGVEELL